MIKFGKLFLCLTFFLINLTSCHSKQSENATKNSGLTRLLSKESEEEIYQFILAELENIKKSNGKDIKLLECQCRSGFVRDLSKINSDLRFQFDRGVLQTLYPLKEVMKELKLFFFGSGKLYQELTAVARLAQAGFSLHIFINDLAYAFYQGQNMAEHIKEYLEQPSTIPEWLSDFWVWNASIRSQNEMNEQDVITFFSDHNDAVDQFIMITQAISKKYQVKITTEVLKHEEQSRKRLGSERIHAYFAIDSFVTSSGLARRIQHDLLDESPRPKNGENAYELFFFLLNKDRFGIWSHEDDKSDAPTRFEVWKGEIDFDKKIHFDLINRIEHQGGLSSENLNLTNHPLFIHQKLNSVYREDNK